MSEIRFTTGCRIEPDPLGMAHLSAVQPLEAATDAPDEFIVPYYRELYDASFKRVKVPVIGKPIKNQRGIPSCVGESTAYQKAATENEEMSGRDAYRLAKRKEQPIDLLSWGTSIWCAMDAQIDTGVATERIVPDSSNSPLEAYVSVNDVTPEVVADRAKHKSLRAYFVNRNEIVSTLWSTQLPVVTSSRWYSGDNYMAGGIMRGSSGEDVGGHAFCVIGVVRRMVDGVSTRCLAVLNSWSEAWGDLGCFYIPLNSSLTRLGNGYVSVDIETSLADVLARYNGKLVKAAGDADCYKIENGMKRLIPDEKVWFSMGFQFGDEMDITASDLDLVPEGTPVNILEAPARSRELVRQIFQLAESKK